MRTNGHIVADHCGDHIALGIVSGHMYCHTVLNICVLTNLNMIDITCKAALACSIQYFYAGAFAIARL